MAYFGGSQGRLDGGGEVGIRDTRANLLPPVATRQPNQDSCALDWCTDEHYTGTVERN
jgi:hypothetical protein